MTQYGPLMSNNGLVGAMDKMRKLRKYRISKIYKNSKRWRIQVKGELILQFFKGYQMTEMQRGSLKFFRDGQQPSRLGLYGFDEKADPPCNLIVPAYDHSTYMSYKNSTEPKTGPDKSRRQ